MPPEHSDAEALISAAIRKIVHIDMDAFYASVEQRDDPTLRGRPVVVAPRGPRSVVCAASYEARRFGIRSAMPALVAERLCPQAAFLPPDFPRYQAVSRAVRAIFVRHTNQIEPLSLDEAYLDVTENRRCLPTATRVAQTIRAEIHEELHLTASAGVAPNKFLAKIASDWKKPDGLFVIQPHQVDSFLVSLPVDRIPGVGRVTEARMAGLGIRTAGDLRTMDLALMERHFGRYGHRLHQLSRGIDLQPVVADRASKSISAEDTFATDIPLAETRPLLCALAARVWAASRQNARLARTIVLKLKTKEFHTLTRSLTPDAMPASLDAFQSAALSLYERIDLGPSQLYRLVGVGLSNFQADNAAGLFGPEAADPAEVLHAPNALPSTLTT